MAQRGPARLRALSLRGSQALRVHLRAEPPLQGPRQKPRPQARPAPQPRSRTAAVTPRCLTFSRTICNIIKSFPNHTRHLSNSKIRPNKHTLSEVIFSDRKQCSLMSHFKRKNDFRKRNNYCNHLLFVQPSNCFDNENQTGASPVCPESSCLLGRQLPPTSPPLLFLSKGISGPAVREPGNRTFSVQPTSERSFDIKSLYCAEENHILVKTFQLAN